MKDDHRIDWGGGADRAIPDLATLIGIEDAFDHTALRAGEQVAFCQRDKVAYHLATWEFLQQQNQGRCCVCGLFGSITLLRLPGVLTDVAILTRSELAPGILRPGEKVIDLRQVGNYVTRAVVVQDFVHEVYCTKKTGTCFVRFEPRPRGAPPFQGFKVVIFSSYQSAWTRAGISLQSYAGHHVCVRGVIQVHPMYGIEILVNSPAVMQVVPPPVN